MRIKLNGQFFVVLLDLIHLIRCLAQGASPLFTTPLQNAVRVEIVSDITWQSSDKINLFEICETNSALIVVIELERVEKTGHLLSSSLAKARLRSFSRRRSLLLLLLLSLLSSIVVHTDAGGGRIVYADVLVFVRLWTVVTAQGDKPMNELNYDSQT